MPLVKRIAVSTSPPQVDRLWVSNVQVPACSVYTEPSFIWFSAICGCHRVGLVSGQVHLFAYSFSVLVYFLGIQFCFMRSFAYFDLVPLVEQIAASMCPPQVDYHWVSDV